MCLRLLHFGREWQQGYCISGVTLERFLEKGAYEINSNAFFKGSLRHRNRRQRVFVSSKALVYRGNYFWTRSNVMCLQSISKLNDG